MPSSVFDTVEQRRSRVELLNRAGVAIDDEDEDHPMFPVSLLSVPDLTKSKADNNRPAAEQLDVFTVEEAADVLRVNAKTLSDSIRRKTFPCIRIGKRVIRISRAYVERLTAGAA